MTFRPAVDWLRTACTPLAPSRAISIGCVTSVSTSSVARPGHSVMMTTRGRSRSGKTSIGSVRRQVAAVDQQRQAEHDDQHAVAEREANDGVQHGRASLAIASMTSRR